MPTVRSRSRRRLAAVLLVAGAVGLAGGTAASIGASAAATPAPATRALGASRLSAEIPPAPRVAGAPNLGANVYIFTPSDPQSEIQSTLDTIANQQVSNQFGPQRYAIFFEPGTYGSAADPLAFQVGFYTEIAGLGATPSQVVINGVADVFNQCSPAGQNCEGTDNFWRSLSNLTLNVDPPSGGAQIEPANGENTYCEDSADLWAASQADPIRSVIVNGQIVLTDYCGQGFVSGGFLANDQFNVDPVADYNQQQYFTRNSSMLGWSNAVWNQVFVGDTGAPATDFGSGGQYTNVATTPVSQEEPFLYTGPAGNLAVYVPAVQHNSVGTDFAGGSIAGTSIPIQRFFVANPSTSVLAIDAALAFGQNLILEPGVYDLPAPIVVSHPNTVVLGLGFATLIPTNGNVTMQVANVPGVKISGLIFDAGPRNSPVLLQVGLCFGPAATNAAAAHSVGTDCVPGIAIPGFGGQDTTSSNPDSPTLLQDVFFRIGGAEAGSATNALIVNSSNTILDDVWAWRADHGAGVGWTENTSNTGLIVNGNNVEALGLAVEHFQKYEVIWNGQGGSDYFFQNEMPYDPPSQAAWMSSPTTDGYAAFYVAPSVTSFSGWGMGSYSYFDLGIPIYATEAFQSPDTPGVQFHDLLTVFLNANGGSGGILSVINGAGGSSTAANPDVPVDVVSYP